MANISNKEIISILETANRWMTFDELSDSIIRERSYTALSLRLQELAEQGKFNMFLHLVWKEVGMGKLDSLRIDKV